jgi:uncharacterized DUF497 family protein
MRISFDVSKSERNVALRGIPFDLAAIFEWDSALIVEDVRRDYGERRFQALGRIEGRLFMLVFTTRKSTTHVISLRKANEREVKRYEAQA